jgi:hypothetical protein
MSRGKELNWNFIVCDRNFYISVGRAALELNLNLTLERTAVGEIFVLKYTSINT